MSNHDARVPVPANAPAPRQEAPVGGQAAVRTPAAPAPVTGLTVGHADDPAEHAADQMADRALERLSRSGADEGPDAGGPGTDRHAHTPGCGHLRRSATATATAPAVVGREGGQLDATTTDDVEAARRGGAPLPAEVRRRMETGFGTGLGHVRVHDGPDAARLSATMGAEAFTTGNDIFFGAGRFAPDTPAGEQVLAHEIAHVISEPAGVRRLWNPFKRSTPEEKAAKKQQKADEAAKAAQAKKDKAAQAAKVKQAKSMVKDKALKDKESRRRGQSARDERSAGYGGADGGAKSSADYKLLDKALARELELFESYLQNIPGRSERDLAEMAYTKVWYDEYAELNDVRPARESSAEKLVAQVRIARTGAGASATAEAADADKLAVVMLPKTIENAYERMVHHRDQLMAKDPTMSVVVAESEAWDTVRSQVPVKEQAGFPQRYDAVDQAAWQQAEERVAARRAQKSRDAKAAQTALALLPPEQRIGPQPKQAEPTSTTVEEFEGIVGQANEITGKIAEVVDDGPAALLPEAPGLELDDIPLHAEISAVVSTSKAVGPSKPGPVVEEAPTPEIPGASDAAGQIGGLLNGLMSAATSATKMAESTEKAWKQGNAYEGLEATKSGANALDGLVAAARSTAEMAETLDSSVSDGVQSVLPGFDIATSVTAMVRGVAEVAAAGMRQRETDTSLFEARLHTGETNQIHESVYSLMKISQVYAQHLEKACWSLGVSVVKFGASLAQLVTAGGLGIPAAVKAATALADKLHDLAHYIAKKVLAAMAQRAETESSVLHLEGAAEQELRRHPKMAVDGIIMKAANRDPIALMFLSNYRIDGNPINEDYVTQIKPKPIRPFDPSAKKSDPTAVVAEAQNESEDQLLVKIRDVVLAGMNTDADPQTVFEELRSTAKSKIGLLQSVKDGWSETGELSEQRNTLAAEGKLGANTKTGRGTGWRLLQMFSAKKRSRLKQKTEAFGSVESLPDGVVLVVGDKELREDAMPYEITEFAESLTIEAIEAEFKRTPRRNTPEWLEYLRTELMTKIAESAKVGVGAGS